MDLSMLRFFNNIYLDALVVLVGFFLLSKIALFIIEKVFLRIALKTKTKVDDDIIECSKNPLSLIILLLGMRLALIILGVTNTWYDIGVKLISSVIVIIITFILIRIAKILIKAWGEKWADKTDTKADDQLVDLFMKFAGVVGWIFGAMYLLTVWEIEIGPFLASVGVAGIAIAFALQESLANIFGGISMFMDKVLKIDDVIELEDGTSGKIREIGLRSTKIQTWDNEVIIIPNSKIANSKIKNIVLPEPKVRVVIPFGVAYGSDVDKVKKIVLAELKKITGFIKDPEPFVKFMEMADSSLNFKAYFWVEAYSMRFGAKDEANTLIYKALNKNDIEIPFPQMDVHIKQQSQNEPKKKLAANTTKKSKKMTKKQRYAIADEDE